MKTVIAGLEEGLNAIAEALEGDNIVPTPAAADEGKVLTAGDDGTASWETPEGGIPTPTLSDEGKVLKAVPQTQTTVAPEWGSIREVPSGGNNGQVLTKDSEGYEWAAVASVPSSNASDSGKVLTCTGRNAYGWAPASGGGSYPEPTDATSGQVLTADGLGGADWQTPSGGGGHMDVVKFDIAKAQFNQDGDMYKVYASTEDPDIATKINNIISMSIVDNIDEGSPDLINPATGELLIYYDYDDELVTIKISSTIYNKLGTRGNNCFYMTYYKSH